MGRQGQFEKGKSGNPGGRPPLVPEALEAKKLTTEQFILTVNKILVMTKEEIIELAKNSSTPAMELIISSIIIKGIQEGDANRLNFILDRLLGRVINQVKIEGELTLPRVIVNIPSNGRERNNSSGSTGPAN